MKLILFYYSQGNSPGALFDKSVETTNKFATNFHTEGLYTLFQQLLYRKIIDECSIVIESGANSGYKQLSEGMDCYVVPNIEQFLPYLNETDVVFVRGGFKSWYNTLLKFEADQRWLWLYAANTGRARWPFWDIVFDDTRAYNSVVNNGRVYLYYKKPINQNIFHYKSNTTRNYDLMIGASNIHDKKGQYRVINMLGYLKRELGFDPKCVLPGALRRGTHTNKLIDNIVKYKLNVDVVGMLPREQLAELMNQTQFFYHGGCGGQNDRGPLEAMACGCVVGTSNPRYHSPIVYLNQELSFLNEAEDNRNASSFLYSILTNVTLNERAIKQKVVNYFNSKCSIGIIVEDFKKLLDFFDKHPKRNRKALREYFNL